MKDPTKYINITTLKDDISEKSNAAVGRPLPNERNINTDVDVTETDS